MTFQNRRATGIRAAFSVSILALLLTLAASFLFFAPGCSREYAFKVNGEGIPKKQFDKEVDRRLSIVERRNPEELEGKNGELLEAETRREVATELIKDTLMKQQAEELGVEAPGDVVGEKLEEERLSQGLDEFKRNLELLGLTEDEYKKTIENRVLIDEIGAKVCERVTVPEEELEDYYLTHKDDFTRGVMVHVAHILLDTESQAQVVLSQLQAGREFSSLAKAYSKDSATSSNGGDLGWIEQGAMDPAFEQVAFALATGQTSDVVKASKGFHIITSLDRREAYAPPLDDIKSDVKATYLTEKKETVFNDWLKTVYGNAHIEIPGDIGEWNPILGIVVKE